MSQAARQRSKGFTARLRWMGVLPLLVANAAFSAGYTCDGQINSVAVGSNGALWVAYGSVGIQGICNVEAATNGIGIGTCKNWFALLTAAQAQQKTVRFYYDSAVSGNPSACSGLQSWTAYYIPYFLQTLD